MLPGGHFTVIETATLGALYSTKLFCANNATQRPGAMSGAAGQYPPWYFSRTPQRKGKSVGPPEQETVRYSLRLPRDLYDGLTALSHAGGWPLHAEMRRGLR